MADTIDLGIAGIGPATLLDRGGSAYVYLAEQEDFGRKVAVKVLFDALEDETTFKRFDRECRAIGAVSHHPNIVVVHGRGLTRHERPYLVMEYRAGGSLAKRLEVRGRMTEAEAISIGSKIGSALQVAHEAGVLHRDVKPANILLSTYNEPALADFGIARMDGTHKTTEGVFSASVVHASREILDSGTPTPRSDVYALASTMFELVTGSPAYADPDDGSIWAVINRVLGQDPPDPRTFGISNGLADVLAKAMSHEPSDRQASASEFVADLRVLNAPVGNRNKTLTMTAAGGGPVLDGNEDLTNDNALLEAAVGVEPGPSSADESDAASSAEPGGGAEVGFADSSGVAAQRAATEVMDRRGLAPKPTAELPGDKKLSRTGLLIAVGVIAVGSLAIGVISVVGRGPTGSAEQAASPTSQRPADTTETGATSLQAVPQSISNDNVEDNDLVMTSDGQGTARRSGTDESEPTDQADDGPSATTKTTDTAFAPELRFPRAEIGPLEDNDRYVLIVDEVPDDAQYRIIVDGRPVTPRESRPPIFFPKSGRHQLQVEVATHDRVELTEAVEIYVSDRPPTSGFRVNLSAIRSRPDNWPEALRQYDQMVLDGHEGLQISLSDRNEGSALPFWNFYVYYGQDRDGAVAYCEDRNLSNEECYTAELE